MPILSGLPAGPIAPAPIVWLSQLVFILMRVAIYEDNLMWSARLVRSLQALGHEAVVLEAPTDTLPAAEVAIVNLGSAVFDAMSLVPALKESGVHVIGHAGHKEKPLLAAGNESGCDQVVSNSSLTFRLAEILNLAQ